MDLQINKQVRRETELHNEKVKKNREILKRLLDCVIFLDDEERSFRGHDEQGTRHRLVDGAEAHRQTSQPHIELFLSKEQNGLCF